MKRSICSLLLILCLLSQLWVPTRAASNMSTSAEGKVFIAELQGGASYSLSKAEKHVNSFMDKYGLQLTQQQFDALVDFVCALSNYTVLTSGNYQIERLISGGRYTDAQLAGALTAWGVKNANGSVSETNLCRRLREAKRFLYGSYSGNCDADFRWVIFNPNGGTLDSNFNTVTCFSYNDPYGDLGIPTKSGKHFAGWYTTAGSGGQHIYNGTLADQNRTLYARWADEPVSAPNTGGTNNGGNSAYPILKVSESLISFIKAHEGFSPTVYSDYSQQSIGYGTKWDPDKYPNGTITEAQADYELRVYLARFEKEVDRVLQKSTITTNQHRYDAIVSFTYNLGTQWVSTSNRIYNYIIKGYPSELEFVDAMGAWASAGGEILDTLMKRRMAEADMYLNGSYDKFSSTYFGAKLLVNTTDSSAVISKSGKSYAVFYCRAGQPVGTLPTATRNGYTFAGWYDTNNKKYTTDTVAPTGTLTLKAKWTKNTGSSGSQPTPDPVTGFIDVSSQDWYAPYVVAAVDKNLLVGLGNDCFGPNNTMTRAMAVTVLHRMAGTPAVIGAHSFTDVEKNTWYTNAITWAYQKNIVNGVSQTRFGVNDSITRQQLVTILYRFAQQVGVDTSGRVSLKEFSDASQIADYAKAPFQWAVAMGIINGNNGRLLPESPATRAQCAKIMVMFSDLMG